MINKTPPVANRRSHQEAVAPKIQQRSDVAGQAGACQDRSCAYRGGSTVDRQFASQSMLLGHIADQKALLLQLLERGVGEQPGNQLAEELKGLIDSISSLEDREDMAAQLCHLRAALMERGAAAIIGGHGVIAYLSQAIGFHQPGTSSMDRFRLAYGTPLWSSRSSGPTQADLRQIIYGNGSALLRSLDGHVDGHASGQVAPDAELAADFGRLLQVIALLGDAPVRNESYAELNEKLLRVTRNQALAKEFLVHLAKEWEAGGRADGIDSVSSLVRDHPEIAPLVKDLVAQDLFRGLTATSEGYVERSVRDDAAAQWSIPDGSKAAAYRAMDGGRTLHALQAVQAAGKAFMPLLWGFRVFDPAQGLFAKEINTIMAYASMARSLQVPVRAPLMLCDVHARHNKIPAGVYEPYYREVERVAQHMGVETIRLSRLYEKLGVTLEQVEGWGAELVQKPAGRSVRSASTALIELPGDYWARLKGQARHTVARFPGVFVVPPGSKPSEKFYGDKALHYAQFRASEGVHVLPRLAELGGLNGAPVLVAHVADPNSGLVGVNGLYIHAKDNANRTVAAIPWGGMDLPQGAT